MNQRSSQYKVFHELMQKKVRHILLVSTSYEAWILEEDGRLSEQITNEYRGLNLSHPPRLHWVSSVTSALEQIEKKQYDLVIIICRTINAGVYETGSRIKIKDQDMPVVVLSHQESLPEDHTRFHAEFSHIDQIFFWSGDAGILLAIIKCIEDRMNVDNDTSCAGIRVIIFVEDSPFYRSSILPVLYKELVAETQAVIDDGLNEEHRILYMRARPKILLAGCYEQAKGLYEQFKPYVLGVISDVRFPSNGGIDAEAGLKLLRYIKEDRFDIPLLLASSEPHNARPASQIPAVFIDKNSRALREKIAAFLMGHLGFGSFIFKLPNGQKIGKATDLYTLEQHLRTIPDESFVYHCRRNDFSRWLFSLAEVELASQLRPLRNTDFESVDTHRQHLIGLIQHQRKNRLKGVIVDFDPDRFDPDTKFLKIGKGSLGGKARGQAFISSLLHRSPELVGEFDTVDIFVPQTLVITTEGFDTFIRMNRLENFVLEDTADDIIAERFTAADFPAPLRAQLAAYLRTMDYPLAVRSSSLLEDAQFKPYAGLYSTYFLSNDHEDLDCRVNQLVDTIKMVYASTYFRAPKAFSASVGNRMENEKMAVIIQQVVGRRYEDSFYPAVSGVAQSTNYYPFSKMEPEDGIVSMAMGLGKAVMEGERNLRCCPRFPQILPDRSTVEDILENAQQEFYALRMNDPECRIGMNEAVTLEKKELYEARHHDVLPLLAGTYFPQDNRIRDISSRSGFPVLTFTSLLRQRTFPFLDIITRLLDTEKNEFGCPVEMEFALDLPADPAAKAGFAVVQVRPMSAKEATADINITDEERNRAFCLSHMALGNTADDGIGDVVYVRPDTFDPAKTREIAEEISRINASLKAAGRKYILIGPGRWGSSDHWLGIPVNWESISQVGTIVETTHPLMKADPSQGSHFFHNIIALGINYLTLTDQPSDRMDYHPLNNLERIQATPHLIHARSSSGLAIKVNGRKGIGVIYDCSLRK